MGNRALIIIERMVENEKIEIESFQETCLININHCISVFNYDWRSVWSWNYQSTSIILRGDSFPSALQSAKRS
ncbi:hypothetical protein D3C73_1485220 [compost metagenome]